jgi:hypothetical protein
MAGPLGGDQDLILPFLTEIKREQDWVTNTWLVHLSKPTELYIEKGDLKCMQTERKEGISPGVKGQMN